MKWQANDGQSESPSSSFMAAPASKLNKTIARPSVSGFALFG
jgi:hypothetical protein